MNIIKSIKLPAIEVQERLFELLDKISSNELQKVEIELDGKVIALLIPIAKK